MMMDKIAMRLSPLIFLDVCDLARSYFCSLYSTGIGFVP